MSLLETNMVPPGLVTSTIPSVVILAAGRGSRIGALTDSVPKCLAAVGGRSLIEHQLDAMAGAGIDDVTVVTGYRARDVRWVVGRRARFVHNPDWSRTNSLYSLWLAGDRIRDDVIVLNCDVLFHPAALTRLIEAGTNRFLIDRPGGLGDEEMHVTLHGSRLVSMGKQIPLDLVDGKSVGMVRISHDTLAAVLAAAADLVAEGDLNAWMASAIDRVAAGYDLHAVDISDLPWVEIDFPADLDRAINQVWPAITGFTGPVKVVAAPIRELAA